MTIPVSLFPKNMEHLSQIKNPKHTHTHTTKNKNIKLKEKEKEIFLNDLFILGYS